MIYVTIDAVGRVSQHNYPFGGVTSGGYPVEGLGKTEAELLQTGYLVESVPEQYPGEVPADKMPELHYNGVEFSWVMVDKPPEPLDPSAEIVTLREQLEAQAAEIAELKAAQNAILGVD